MLLSAAMLLMRNKRAGIASRYLLRDEALEYLGKGGEYLIVAAFSSRPFCARRIQPSEHIHSRSSVVAPHMGAVLIQSRFTCSLPQDKSSHLATL
jgi:hypothetical protein